MAVSTSDRSVFNYKKYLDAIRERDRLREENKKMQLEACKLMRNEVDILRKENERLKSELISLQVKTRGMKEQSKENYSCM